MAVANKGSADTPEVTRVKVANKVRRFWNGKAAGEDRIITTKEWWRSSD